MELTQTSNWTETLANLSLPWILSLVVGLTVLRLGLVQVRNPLARAIAEIFESAMIAIVLVFLVIQPFVVRAYFIPSPSMEPTLLGENGHGDRILVNKLAYRLHPPRRDDVVVFIAPSAAMEGNPDFIKRLIGLPGDRLQVVRGQFIVDGTSYSHPAVRKVLRDAGLFGSEAVNENDMEFVGDHHAKFIPNGVLADGHFIPKQQVAALLLNAPARSVEVKPGYVVRNGRRLQEPFTAEDPDYDLNIFHGQPLKFDPSGPPEYRLGGMEISDADYRRDSQGADGRIPPHTYFMMGDNRNDSKDSTEWGPLDAQRVVGQAQVIFWPPGRMRAIH